MIEHNAQLRLCLPLGSRLRLGHVADEMRSLLQYNFAILLDVLFGAHFHIVSGLAPLRIERSG